MNCTHISVVAGFLHEDCDKVRGVQGTYFTNQHRHDRTLWTLVRHCSVPR